MSDNNNISKRKMKTALKMFRSDEVDDATICPLCNTSLEPEYQSYMVAIREKGEIQTVMMGGEGGYFCPSCSTVVIDPKIFEEVISEYVNSQTIEYAIAGIVDLDAVPEDKKDIPLGDDDNPIPLIRLDPVSTPSQKQKKARVERNDPCPCGSGKKYKKCCMGKNGS